MAQSRTDDQGPPRWVPWALLVLIVALVVTGFRVIGEQTWWQTFWWMAYCVFFGCFFGGIGWLGDRLDKRRKAKLDGAVRDSTRLP